MTEERNPQQHIINILKNTKEHHPNFALFLGAGASVTSGIPSAKTMIEDWRKQYQDRTPSTDIKSKPWYEDEQEYSTLFELLYDQPSQRREYIEKCVNNATPSWGYIYLVNLLQKVFNTVFTTNFDDLLNEACYLYSNSTRPIVCAHDSSIYSVRITTKRPKIIKLHGDFLFDNIKNTSRELETLEENIRNKFKQYASEFGLIVIGYAGHDRSVMDTLNALLRTETNFPHGVYWCVRKGSKLSKKVEDLNRFPQFHIVEIEGFDQFFAELHSQLDMSLQKEMSDPYNALTERLNNLINSANIPVGLENNPNKKSPTHSIIASDIAKLVEQIKSSFVGDSNKSREVPASSVAQQASPPYQLMAQQQWQKGEVTEAKKTIIKQLETQPTISAFNTAFELLNIVWDDVTGQHVIKVLKEREDIIASNPNCVHNFAVSLINTQQFSYAEEVLNIGFEVDRRNKQSLFNKEYFYLNKAQICLWSQKPIDPSLKENIEILQNSAKKDIRLGASIILGQYEEAKNILLAYSKNEFMSKIVWPILLFIPEDIQAEILKKQIYLCDNPNNAFYYAIYYIKFKRFKLAETVLKIAYDCNQKGLTKVPLDNNYYLLNKAQIKLHQSKKLPPAEVAKIQELLTSPEPLVRIGAHIVLGQTEQAENLYKEVKNEAIRQWPIFQLLNKNMQAPVPKKPELIKSNK
ncbi:MAG TPA: SIR2 family protein [Rickettsiales bacterium]|nr:SIR2 family protein [Rickettsiales bacterium]